MSFSVKRVSVAPGIGGYWVNDQAAVQGGASPDGFFFEGAPVTPGFKRIREDLDTVGNCSGKPTVYLELEQPRWM